MPPFDTALCRTLDTDHPLGQVPIGSASCPALAAAVSEADRLGTLAVTWRSLEARRRGQRSTGRAADDGFALDP
ncbi:hypothetical protein ACFQPA_08690 [Halomarina halobia]|uniref:Uncharacterized protein n=1 Tax=Halomarina halobia TaxID=3033386 RepID=A0ABD6ACT6_9EURY|nr:hypothetical protein [Halomarina sp. PSR21]